MYKKYRSRGGAIASKPLRIGNEPTTESEVQINIVPLIDVIFCILTFFILAAVGLSRQQAIQLNLPKATSGQAQMREILVVSLDDVGQTYVEQQPVTEEQLEQQLENYRKYNPQGLMVLHASKNSKYDRVIHILDILKQTGGDRVALATLPGESSSGTTNSTNNENLLPQIPNNNTGTTVNPKVNADVPGTGINLPKTNSAP
jgi:biopolymer transport protein ExbD